VLMGVRSKTPWNSLMFRATAVRPEKALMAKFAVAAQERFSSLYDLFALSFVPLRV
jgi:hypothetical protein